MVMADVSENTVEGRSGVGITYRWSMMISTAQYGAVLVGPLPLAMSEDKDDEVIMKIVESVPVGGDNVVRKDVSILAELGDKGWRRAIVRVGANVEIGFVAAAHTRTRSVVYVTRMFEMSVVRFVCE